MATRSPSWSWGGIESGERRGEGDPTVRQGEDRFRVAALVELGSEGGAELVAFVLSNRTNDSFNQ